ncbi:hypothetical protein AT236_01118 [Lactobacillus delbrueckii subsp. bulgaricus]|nr:hypothetical protein AT236_01118 [Lactobacillus delbrueckii subsp. bulgaricus]
MAGAGRGVIDDHDFTSMALQKLANQSKAKRTKRSLWVT